MLLGCRSCWDHDTDFGDGLLLDRHRIAKRSGASYVGSDVLEIGACKSSGLDPLELLGACKPSEVRLSTPTIPSQFPELFEIERAFLFFLRTGCLLGRSSRLRLFSSAPIVGTTALLGGTPSPTVRIAELRFFWSFGLLAIARASKIQVDSIGPRRLW
jgi:hypothetical protein